MEHSSAISGSRSRSARKLIQRILFPQWLLNRRVKVSRPGYMFMVLVAFIGGAAFNTGNNLLYLVLAMLLAALLFSFSISEYMIAGLEIKRDAIHMVTQGKVFTVNYIVKNTNRLVPALAMTVQDKLEGEAAMAYVTYLRAKEESRIKGKTLATRRGRLAFRETLISTSAPLGLFSKTKRARLQGEVIALPSYRVSEEERSIIAARGSEVCAHRRGRGDELFGFREYVRGDQVREIHWKTSARTGKLMIKEKEREEERRIRICLELTVPRPEGRDENREQAVHKAASLAASAVEQGWLVRVEADGKGVDFGTGGGHLQSVLYFLAMFDDPQTPEGMPLSPDDSACITVF